MDRCHNPTVPNQIDGLALKKQAVSFFVMELDKMAARIEIESRYVEYADGNCMYKQ